MEQNLRYIFNSPENRKKFWIGSLLSITVIAVILYFVFTALGEKITPEQKNYIAEIEKSRQEKDGWMKNDPASPFNAKNKVDFHKLKYYPIDPGWVYKSKLTQYNQKDELFIYGTKGEIRKTIRFGYITFGRNDIVYKLNVYQGESSRGEKYYSIWYTDKTTNKETYGVGRYIDFEISEDANFIYTIDFNLAYNPYCAYSPDYSCAIPTKEDYLPLEIKAGEKKFHD